MPVRRRALLLAVIGLIFWGLQPRSSAQQATTLHIQAVTADQLRQWDTYVTQRERSGDLRIRSVTQDPMLPSRRLERLQQFHDGVPIWGSELVRESDGGLPTALFGELSSDLDLSVDPTLSFQTASDRLKGPLGDAATLGSQVDLVIVRVDSGEYKLAY